MLALPLLWPLSFHHSASRRPSSRPRRTPTLNSMCADPAQPGPSQPAGIHPGVLCDKTMAPIVGFRYTDGKGYDLCQAEFDKLSAEEQRRFQQLAPPITPRRALLAAAVALGGVQLASLLPAQPSSVQDGCSGARQASSPSDVSADCYAAFDTPFGTLAEDFLMPPPPSAAERLVDFVFKPQVPAGRREADPTAKRRVGGRAVTEEPMGAERREPVARRPAPAAEPDR